MASEPTRLSPAPGARPQRRENARSYWSTMRQVTKCAAAIHAALCVLFFWFGSPILAWTNVLSIVIYGAAYRCLARRQNKAALMLIWSEVLGHATIATLLLGWDSAFHFYLLVFIPVIFINARTTKALGAVAVLWSFYLALKLATSFSVPLEPLAPLATSLISYFNISAVFAMLSFLAWYYSRSISAAQRRLNTLATTDPLTGLYNRRHIMDVANGEADRRAALPARLSFIIGDIDLFKGINDSHGHDTGDSVLVAVSKAIRDSIREQDSAARWGGEEFLIMLQDTDLENALHIAQRIRTNVAAMAFPTKEHSLTVSITLGVSSYRAGENISDAICRADDALYRGKHAGRNRVESNA